MATTVSFKFNDQNLDTLSAAMLAEISVSNLKARIVDLYDNEGGLAVVGQGKFFMANTDDGINGRICFVAACFVLNTFEGVEGATRLVIHLRDVSDTWQIPPTS